MDTLTPAQRRRAMQGSRSRGTSPELMVESLLEGRVPYERNVAVGPFRHGPQGRVRWIEVDFIVAVPSVLDQDFALEIKGCFWHGCPRCFKAPKTNEEYWAPKIAANKRRDRTNRHALVDRGYATRNLWEHDVRENTPRFRRVIDEILEACG